MWDTVQINEDHLSHDMPCARCGHDGHFFLACGIGCACEPLVMPGVMPGVRLPDEGATAPR